MKKVLIIPNPKKDVGLKTTDKVIKKLKNLGIRAQVSDGCMPAERPDLIIIIGGDGSVIDAASYATELSGIGMILLKSIVPIPTVSVSALLS